MHCGKYAVIEEITTPQSPSSLSLICVFLTPPLLKDGQAPASPAALRTASPGAQPLALGSFSLFP
uniref:Uncharacterized protein n=1 Tax=Anguilla anguilla TaxID=7936 RepID=A0A0E9VZJ0_ANGAN